MPDHPTHLIRFADLPSRKITRFTVEPGDLSALAKTLDVSELRKLRLTGELRPMGKSDWALTAQLGATAVQPCAVTMAPVVTRVDTELTRRYLAQWELPEGDEMEMPEDTDAEPLPEVLDLVALATEELALALPDFPRAEGAELGEVLAAPEGAEPLTDEAAKPFAGLAALRDKLSE